MVLLMLTRKWTFESIVNQLLHVPFSIFILQYEINGCSLPLPLPRETKGRFGVGRTVEHC